MPFCLQKRRSFMNENKDVQLTDEARQKMAELLTCGNERVELAAAKEIVSLFDKGEDNSDGVHLEVTIKIV